MRDKWGKKVGEYLCSCGTIKNIVISKVKNGSIKTCGCAWKKKADTTLVMCQCGKEFEVRNKRLMEGKGRYCSQECKYKYRKMPKRGKGNYKLVKENPTSFKKGVVTWNTGLAGKGVCKPNSGSIKKGEKRGVDTQFKKGVIPVTYKGDKVGYHALHRWVSNHRGKASLCIECGATKNVQWANKSHEYKRELDDFIELCSKCHRAYDKDHLGIATKKYNLNKNKRSKKNIKNEK